MKFSAGFRTTCLLLLTATLGACSGEDEDRDRLAEMEQEIVDYVGVPVCEDDADCRTIGVGAKPCGGPWYFLIYSVSSVDSVRLANMVAAYNDYNDELNREHNWISDCSVPNRPDPVCHEGRCVAAWELE